MTDDRKRALVAKLADRIFTVADETAHSDLDDPKTAVLQNIDTAITLADRTIFAAAINVSNDDLIEFTCEITFTEGD